MDEQSKEELKEKIKKLEEQNKRLLGQETGKITVTEVEKNGFPLLQFESPPHAPFKIGIRKLATIKSVLPRVEKFLSKHSKISAKYMLEEEEKI